MKIYLVTAIQTEHKQRDKQVTLRNCVVYLKSSHVCSSVIHFNDATKSGCLASSESVKSGRSSGMITGRERPMWSAESTEYRIVKE
jgi:hypothetical protein